MKTSLTSQASDPTRDALRALLENLPHVECNSFHHDKADYHSGFDCPVCKRWQAAVEQACKALATPPPADVPAQGQVGQVQQWMRGAVHELFNFAPDDPVTQRKRERAAAIIAAHAPKGSADSERLDYLIAQCYLPDDCPRKGIYLVAAYDAIPAGHYGLNEEHSKQVVRAAIDAALKAVGVARGIDAKEGE